MSKTKVVHLCYTMGAEHILEPQSITFRQC